MAPMTVIEITGAGGPEVLQVKQRPIPIPRQGEVLIKLAYAGINRPDVLQRSGSYNPPKGASDLPGLEGAGIISAIGSGVFEWKVGDEVCALLPGGGYAEYAVTPSLHCLPVPKGLSLKEAACLPETFFTVYSNLFQRGGLKAGEKFLVHGGSSGIGTTAIQMAHLFGARVFATAGSERKCQVCKDLGAERVINYHNEIFEDVLQVYGRLVQIAFLESAKADLNLAQMMTRRLSITGSTLRPQNDLVKQRIAEGLQKHIWPHLASGRIAPIMDSEFPLAEAARAHTRMETSEHIGKIVLKI